MKEFGKPEDKESKSGECDFSCPGLPADKVVTRCQVYSLGMGTFYSTRTFHAKII